MSKHYTITMKIIIYLSFFIVLFPLAILLVWSFTGIWPWPDLFPKSFSLRALWELFGGYSGAIKILFSSILISIAVALLSIAISIPAARAIVLYDFFGRSFLKFAVLMPVIVP
ncbi:MAG: ABC transporter permease, partial [Clostridiaceae bacterium]|nr:ABC transporter permease [Clostridiaceae bacterium]